MSTETPDKKDRKIALVVVDVQRKFTGGTITDEKCKNGISTVNKVASMFRSSGRPVIFIYFDGPCHGTYDKDDGDEYLHGIESDPKDIIVHKEYMDSFQGSRLAEAVKECGCDSVLIAGMVTQYCVLGTYFGAFEYDISPYLLEGGMISTEEKYNMAACTLCKVFTLGDVEENLRTTKIPEPAKMYGCEYQRCGASGQ